LTSVSVQLSKITSDSTIHIRKKGQVNDELSIIITNDLHYDNNNLNILFNHEDHIEVYCSGNGQTKDPIVDLFLARDSGLVI
jgi:hypothetical protein